MILRSRTVLVLAGCCLVLAGCPSTDDTVITDPVVEETVVEDSAVSAAAEPSVHYLSSDAPEGTSRAVVVEGYPLVYTRQLLPLDGEGNLVGEGSAEKQIEQVLANLEAVLTAAGSGPDKLVRLNVYADSPQTVQLLNQKRADAASRPAITSVVSPLPHPGALVAVDAVAIVAEKGDTVALQRCEAVAGDKGCADAAVMPTGGVVYLSGQPDKSPRVEAAAKSLAALLEIVDQLELERSQVVQLKVFVDSAEAADEVFAEVRKLFPGELTPPVVFAEWISSAPVEIEMIVHLPLTGDKPAEPLRFYTPPDVKPSPTFSRVAVVETDRQIYISGLASREAGDGEAQVRDVFAQLEQILSETGSDLRHLAKATYYVSDDDASTMLNKLRPEFYDPERPPAASKVMVHAMGQSDRTLTMDMIATSSGR